MKRLRDFKYLPLFNFAMMAGSGTLLVHSCARLLNVGLAAPIYWASGLGIFAYYIFDSFPSQNAEDHINRPARVRFFKQNAKLLVSLAILAGVIGAILLGTQLHHSRQISFLVVMGLLAITYASWWGGLVKRVPYAKTFWIAVTWAFAAIGIPLIFSARSFGTEFLSVSPLVLLIFWLLFNDTLCLDFRDAPGDRRADLRTIAQWFSKGQIKALFLFSSVVISALILSAYHDARIDAPVAIVLVATLLWQGLMQAIAISLPRAQNFLADQLIMSWRFLLAVLISTLI